MTKHSEEPRIIFCSERAYGVALVFERAAVKYDCTPFEIARLDIKKAHRDGRHRDHELLLDVYDILIARHCTDGNVRFIWEIDEKTRAKTGFRDLSDIDRNLELELRKVCAEVSAMTNKEAVEAVGTQRITLTLPKGLVYFAHYRSLFEKALGGGAIWWEVSEGHLTLDDKLCVYHRNRFLEDVLVDYLEEEFHWFATRGHYLLYPDPDQGNDQPSC